MAAVSCWLPAFFKISSFVFNRRKKHIQVWGWVTDDTFFILGEPLKGEVSHFFTKYNHKISFWTGKLVESILRKKLNWWTNDFNLTLLQLQHLPHTSIKVFSIREEFAQQFWLEFRSCVDMLEQGDWDSFKHLSLSLAAEQTRPHQ